MAAIQSSELLTNPDGSIFHLHLLAEDIADDIILVGDPGRVETIASHFEHIEFKKSNREFYTITGSYHRHRLTVVSTGIGPDNIDIVINELDALANIDLKSKEIKATKRALNIVRIGTSGSVQADIPVNSFVISEKSIGCDGVLRFYAGNEAICDRAFEEAFIQHCQWTSLAARPYVVSAAPDLVERLDDGQHTFKGVTLTAVGFYGPQGRVLRLPLAMPGINDRITAFRFGDYKITNYEMESAAITGLCNLLGHRAATICLIIANRITGDASSHYYQRMEELIQYTLNRLSCSCFL
ncbi:MAG: nucleoside phosphorylase [Odoribacter sp.]